MKKLDQHSGKYDNQKKDEEIISQNNSMKGIKNDDKITRISSNENSKLGAMIKQFYSVEYLICSMYFVRREIDVLHTMLERMGKIPQKMMILYIFKVITKLQKQIVMQIQAPVAMIIQV